MGRNLEKKRRKEMYLMKPIIIAFLIIGKAEDPREAPQILLAAA